MPQYIEAYKARTNLGNLLNEVSYGKRSFIIRRAKRPMAAVIPVDIYQALLEVPDEDIEIYSDKRLKQFLKEERKSLHLGSR